MNCPFAFLCCLRGGRKRLVASVVTLTGVAAAVFLVMFLAGGPKLYVMRGGMKMFEYDVNGYGICPECRKAIEASFKRRVSNSLWDGRVWGEADRASSRGRPLSGFGYDFECPACGARIRASVEFWGRRTQKHPFGEQIRVWGLDSVVVKEPVGEPLHGETNTSYGAGRTGSLIKE